MERFMVIIALLLGFATLGQPCMAMDAISEGYPGRSSKTGKSIHYARELTYKAVTTYYGIYDRWPKNAAEMRDAGLLQADLLGFNLEPIDLDDREMNFSGTCPTPTGRTRIPPTSCS